MNSFGLCKCGCGQRTRRAPYSRPECGWVKGEPLDYIMNHDKRLNVKWIIDVVTDCWKWNGAINIKGYGNYRGRMAHRVIYEKHHGKIPKGYTVDHLCRNRACVNPDHLEAVPHIENCHRGEQTKLTTDQVHDIRNRKFSGYRHNIRLAREFGVSVSSIEGIRYGFSRTKS